MRVVVAAARILSDLTECWATTSLKSVDTYVNTRQEEAMGRSLIIIALLTVAAGCSKADAVSCGAGTVLHAGTCVVASTVPGSTGSEPSPSDPTPTTNTSRSPSRLDELMEKSSLAEAIAFLRPQMSDAQDSWSAGGIALSIWATKHLRWADVEVSKNETSFALVRKDSEVARGKRMCTSGDLIQIEKQGAGDDKGYSGLLLNDYGNIYAFYAAGDTGELVARSRARLCGVVVGTYDYANSGGGQGHAVAIVGMFDLPQNKKP